MHRAGGKEAKAVIKSGNLRDEFHCRISAMSECGRSDIRLHAYFRILINNFGGSKREPLEFVTI